MEGEIRFIGDMQRLRPEPGDVYVVTTERSLLPEQVDRIKSMVSRSLGGAQVIVMCGGLRLDVAAAPTTKGALT